MQVFGVGRWLLVNRRYLGLSMALAHTVHFAFVAALVLVQGEPLDLVTIVGGGLAFVLMWAMAATSNDAAMRRLQRNWRRLHLVGLHYLWIVFMQSFAGRLGADDPHLLYAGLTAAGAAALVLRTVAYWRNR